MKISVFSLLLLLFSSNSFAEKSYDSNEFRKFLDSYKNIDPARANSSLHGEFESIFHHIPSEQALSLYEKALKGNSIKQYTLANFLLGEPDHDFEGISGGFEVNYKAGREWMKRAATNGHRTAQTRLSFIPEEKPEFFCMSFSRPDELVRQGRIKDAKGCLLYLAENGDSISQYTLAKFFLGKHDFTDSQELANEFEINEQIGLKWMQEAATNGHRTAQNELDGNHNKKQSSTRTAETSIEEELIPQRKEEEPYLRDYKKKQNSAGLDMMDDVYATIYKLSEGNPGAIRVITEMMKTTAEIDPYTLSPLNLLSFDSYGILGSKIWMLYKDVCKEKIVCVHGVMRSLQLGLESSKNIYHAIENRGKGLDAESVLEKVKKRLPNFAKKVPVEEEVKVEKKSEDSGIVATTDEEINPSEISYVYKEGLAAAFLIGAGLAYCFL